MATVGEVPLVNLDDDPALQAILAAHTAEQPAEVALEPEAEELYAYHDKLYTASELQAECSYLARMGKAALQETIAPFRATAAERQQFVHPVIPETKHETPKLTVPEPKPQQERQTEPMPLAVPQEIIESIARTEEAEPLTPPIITELKVAPPEIDHEAVKQQPAIEAAITEPQIVIKREQSAATSEEVLVPHERPTTHEVTATEVPQQTIEAVAPAAQETAQTPEVSETIIDKMSVLEAASPKLSDDLGALIEHVGVEVVEAGFEPVLPEDVTSASAEYLETATPEQAVLVEALTVLIEAAADRLTILAEADQLDDMEAVEIEKLLIEWYDQLLTELGIEHDEETVREFVASIIKRAHYQASDAQVVIEEIAEEESTDEGTHEKKHFISQILASGTSEDSELFSQHWWVGRLAVAGH
jgi:hypothetical protein